MIQKLIANIQKTHAPIVVGLDPMLNLHPGAHRKKSGGRARGDACRLQAEAIWQYNKEIVDAILRI